MEMQTILLVIPAIGAPHLEEKLALLKHNLSCVYKTKPEHSVLHLDITCYATEQDPNTLRTIALQCGLDEENVTVRVDKGYLGEFLYRYITPERVSPFDYVFLFLDDIRLCDSFSLTQFMRLYKQGEFDILSPAMTRDSAKTHDYMLVQNSVDHYAVRYVTIIEFFVYLLRKDAYVRYYTTFLSEQTRWMWGIDFALHHAGFRLGIDNHYTFHHYYKGESYRVAGSPNPTTEMKALSQKNQFAKFKQLGIMKDEGRRSS